MSTTVSDQTMPQAEPATPATPTAPVMPAMPGTPGQPVLMYYVPPAPKPKRVYEVGLVDGLFALITLVVGYLWWDWLLPRSAVYPIPQGEAYIDRLPGVGVTAFFVLVLAVSMAYYRLKGVRLSPAAIVGAGLILLASIPFALYATTPLHVLLGMALVAGFVTWHAVASRTACSRGLDAGIVIDAVNQWFPAPFTNLGAWWSGFTQLLHKHEKSKQVVIVVVGVFVSLPIIIAVVALLMSADAGFQNLVQEIGRVIGTINFGRFFWQTIGAVPIALFASALLYANANRQGTNAATRDGAERVRRGAQKVPASALAAPVVILDVIYVAFFAAMGTYLFSGFAGNLPDGFTYADYARRGFFELAVVAAINGLVIAFCYLFAVRRGAGYSAALRWSGVVLCVMTLLLIATSVSKMVLYIDAYGLTRLRFFTMAFMIVQAIVFGLVLARHLKVFAVSRPIIITILVAFIGLAWANPEGIIARYDVSRYQTGDLQQVDIDYLSTLGDAAIPSIASLTNDYNPVVAQAARVVLQDRGYENQAPMAWVSWTWQSQSASNTTQGR